MWAIGPEAKVPGVHQAGGRCLTQPRLVLSHVPDRSLAATRSQPWIQLPFEMRPCGVARC
jgi:hypothetical protein